MVIYNDVVSFGGVLFRVSNIRTSERTSTLKTNVGKTFIEKQIFLRNKNDTVLQITGVIEGLSQTYGQSLSDAIETDRTALIALDDGYKHAYDDGKHTGDFVIQKDSLSWNDASDQIQGQANKFTMTVIEW